MKTLKPALLLIPLIIFTFCATAENKPKYQFKWPVPCQFTVIGKVLKKGNIAKLEMRVSVSKSNNGKNLKMHWDKVKVLSFNGVDVSKPEIQKMLAPVLVQLETMYFDYEISSDGEFIALLDYENKMKAAIERIAALSPKAEEIAKIMSQQKEIMKIVVLASAKQRWNSWVGGWLGADLEEGEVFEGESVEKVGYEYPSIKMKYKYSHLGISKEYPGAVHLKLVSQPDKEDAKNVIQHIVKKFAGENPREEQINEMMKQYQYKVDSEMEVITDPYTMKPYWVFFEKDIKLNLPGKRTMQRVDSYEYEFHWDTKK